MLFRSNLGDPIETFGHDFIGHAYDWASGTYIFDSEQDYPSTEARPSEIQAVNIENLIRIHFSIPLRTKYKNEGDIPQSKSWFKLGK